MSKKTENTTAPQQLPCGLLPTAEYCTLEQGHDGEHIKSRIIYVPTEHQEIEGYKHPRDVMLEIVERDVKQYFDPESRFPVSTWEWFDSHVVAEIQAFMCLYFGHETADEPILNLEICKGCGYETNKTP